MSVAATARPAFTAAIISGRWRAMFPAYPPLPVPSNRRFQPEIGIQTSTLISESLVGVNVAVTRQNGRTSWYVRPSGPVNVGPGTETADVITPSCNGTVISVSQVTAVATFTGATTLSATKRHARIVFMVPPPVSAAELLRRLIGYIVRAHYQAFP